MTDSKLDLKEFYNACSVNRVLDVGKAEDQELYIDLSESRGYDSVKSLLRTITLLSAGRPTHQLFTGVVGSGKTTELLRLKAELEKQNYHVVYFSSYGDLDLRDVGVNDIIIAIALEISLNLEKVGIKLKPGYFANFFGEIADFLQAPINLSAELSLPLGLGKITSITKSDPSLRQRLRELLDSRTDDILELVNTHIIEAAYREIKEQGKKGLAVIIDNLDRIYPRKDKSGDLHPEYLFLDRGDQLKRLNCHIVYTVPYFLVSLNYHKLNDRFENPPRVLYLAATRLRDGSDYPEGLNALVQIVLARAFPRLNIEQRLKLGTTIFDTQDTLSYLCRVSGGHVRILQILLSECLIHIDDFPIHKSLMKKVVAERCHNYTRFINTSDLDLLAKLHRDKYLNGDSEILELTQKRLVYPYMDEEGIWFGINPILEESKEIRNILKE